MLIRNINDNDKPRERYEKYGNAISNEELLAIIISSGIKNMSCKDLALEILSKVKNINELKDITIMDLMKVKGIGKSKAITLLCSLELGKRVYYIKDNSKIKLNNSTLIYERFKGLFIGVKQELFYALYLDTKSNLIEYKQMFCGTLNMVNAHPREIFKEAVKLSACFIIVVHNHPSGDPSPSEEDEDITQRLVQSGNMIGIKVIDHIIFGMNSYYSFYEKMNKKV